MLSKYDWLHLHHEDFTGQYGKFYKAYRSAAWYQAEVERQSTTAQFMGFQKVSEMKREVATTIRDFVLGGGFLFTMFSGTDSYDIALAAQGVDICGPMFEEELRYWGIEEKLIEPCCWMNYIKHRDAEASMNLFDGSKLFYKTK